MMMSLYSGARAASHSVFQRLVIDAFYIGKGNEDGAADDGTCKWGRLLYAESINDEIDARHDGFTTLLCVCVWDRRAEVV